MQRSIELMQESPLDSRKNCPERQASSLPLLLTQQNFARLAGLAWVSRLRPPGDPYSLQQASAWLLRSIVPPLLARSINKIQCHSWRKLCPTRKMYYCPAMPLLRAWWENSSPLSSTQINTHLVYKLKSVPRQMKILRSKRLWKWFYLSQRLRILWPAMSTNQWLLRPAIRPLTGRQKKKSPQRKLTCQKSLLWAEKTMKRANIRLS